MPDAPRASRVTMQDIAREAGVSQSTVPFVLNGNTDVRIAEATRDRVMETVARLGYQHRSGGKTRMRGVEAPFIGFMIDEIATSIFAAISIEGAQEAAWKSGYVLDVAMTGSDGAYEQMVLDRWTNDGVAGVIYGSILTRSGSCADFLALSRITHSEALARIGSTTAAVNCAASRCSSSTGKRSSARLLPRIVLRSSLSMTVAPKFNAATLTYSSAMVASRTPVDTSSEFGSGGS